MRTVTIAQFAKNLGVHRQTLHRMRKNGELPPTIATTRRIVRWLESDVELWFELDCCSTAKFIALKQTKKKFSRK